MYAKASLDLCRFFSLNLTWFLAYRSVRELFTPSSWSLLHFEPSCPSLATLFFIILILVSEAIKAFTLCWFICRGDALSRYLSVTSYCSYSFLEWIKEKFSCVCVVKSWLASVFITSNCEMPGRWGKPLKRLLWSVARLWVSIVRPIWVGTSLLKLIKPESFCCSFDFLLCPICSNYCSTSSKESAKL